MHKLTIRLTGYTADRLKSLAKSRDLTVNKLMEQVITLALANFDVETRFRAVAAQGDPAQALKILDRLDAQAGR